MHNILITFNIRDTQPIRTHFCTDLPRKSVGEIKPLAMFETHFEEHCSCFFYPDVDFKS